MKSLIFWVLINDQRALEPNMQGIDIGKLVLVLVFWVLINNILMILVTNAQKSNINTMSNTLTNTMTNTNTQNIWPRQ